MAYEFEHGEKLGRGIRRIVRKQISRAADELKNPIGSEAIHNARSHVKQARAALRLVRSGMKRKIYRDENAALRKVARDLSGMRDAEVLLDTIEKLRHRTHHHDTAAALMELREALLKQS